MKKDLYFLLLNLVLIIIFLGILLLFTCNKNIYLTEGFTPSSYVSDTPSSYVSDTLSPSPSPYSFNVLNQNSFDTSVRSTENAKINYNADALDIQYHDTIDDIISQKGLDSNSINVYDNSGNLVKMDITSKMAKPIYYEPGTMKYKTGNFLPTYDDTVYFSGLTGLSYSSPIEDTNEQLGGFCSFNKNFPEKIDEMCNKLGKNICAATDCCVLLGGSKCVAGNEKGPIMKKYYNDLTVKYNNKYFYKGDCYGNCINDFNYSNNLDINTYSNFYSYDNLSYVPNVSPETSIPSPNVSPETSIPSPNVSPETSIPSPNVSPETSIPSPNISPEISAPSPNVSPVTSAPSPNVSPVTSASSPNVSPVTSAPSPNVSPVTSAPSPNISLQVTSYGTPFFTPTSYSTPFFTPLKT